MKSLERRLADLELKAQSSQYTCCVVCVNPGEDPEQKTQDALTAFVAEHGREPTITVVRQFVAPAPRDEE